MTTMANRNNRNRDRIKASPQVAAGGPMSFDLVRNDSLQAPQRICGGLKPEINEG
jgi:hypothetical protein